jgi:tetratricopeptide (TPR) repeat protein
MSERINSILVNGVVMALVCLFLFVAGTWWRMQAQLNLGDDAFRRGDFSGAVAGYESALHMYLPGHPAMERAARQLWSLGEFNERQGDLNRALIAYRALRSSWYAVRWLKQPGQNWIDRCDRKIVALAPLQIER